jgi:exodeoxyribonuclease V alpha subunit
MPENLISSKVEKHEAYKWLFKQLNETFDDNSLSWNATSALFDAMNNAHTAKVVSSEEKDAIKNEKNSKIYSVYNTGVGESNPSSLIVLDEQHSLIQIRKWFEYEKAIAANLANRVAKPVDMALDSLPIIRQFLDDVLVNRNEEVFPPLQKIAVLQALKNKFTVITGGPGTGKTYTVSALIISALLLAKKENRTLKIALCAPTGKAAARMNESINSAFQNFEKKGLLTQIVLPELKAQTIHSLIGYDSFYDKTYNDSEAFVEADLVIVDEASMVDLPLMYHLLKSVPDTSSMVLLGDPDQLSSVESGAVLANICENGQDNLFDDVTKTWLKNHFNIAHAKLPNEQTHKSNSSQRTLFEETNQKLLFKNQIIRLLESHRFKSDTLMGQLVEGLRENLDVSKQWEIIKGAIADNSLQGITSPEGLTNDLMQILMNRLEELHKITSIEFGRKLIEEHAKVKDVFDLVNAMALLSPTHHGKLGVDSLNTWFEINAKQKLGLTYKYQEHYPGRLIMITQNDKSSGLFNGDIGVGVIGPTGELIYIFEDLEKGVKQSFPAMLPNHKSAYVMTVHKSQGSEYNQVVLLLPAYKKQYKDALNMSIINRELLYTAITRAKEKAIIVGQEALWLAFANKTTKRDSGLNFRLKEIANIN